MPIFNAPPGLVDEMRRRRAAQATSAPEPSQADRVLDMLIQRLGQPTPEPETPENLSVGRRLQLALTGLGNPQGFRDIVLPELQRRDPGYQAAVRQEREGTETDRLTNLYDLLAGKESAAAKVEAEQQKQTEAAAQMRRNAELSLTQVPDLVKSAMGEASRLRASGVPGAEGLAQNIAIAAARLNALAQIAAADLEENIPASQFGLDVIKSGVDDLMGAMETAARGMGPGERSQFTSQEAMDRFLLGQEARETEAERRRQHDVEMAGLRAQASVDSSLRRAEEGLIPPSNTDFTDMQDAMSLNRMAVDLYNAYEQLGRPGGFGTYLKKVASGRRQFTPEEIVIDNKLQAYNLPARQDVLGSAITKIESDFGATVFPELGENPEVIAQALKGNVERTYNRGLTLIEAKTRGGKGQFAKGFEGAFTGLALPPDVPEGSIKVGELPDGSVIYQTPDGQRVTWSP